jgi:cytoskeleton protein RodZ
MSTDSREVSVNAPGVLLSAARERAGLTLQQVAEQLHLDLATVQSLENGRYETLGAVVFVRGHLRRYAGLLAVPASEIEAAYAAVTGRDPLQPDLRRISSRLNAPPAPNPTLSPRLALIGAIALVLFGLVWWAMRVPHSHRAGSAPTPASATSTVATAVAAPAADAAPVQNPGTTTEVVSAASLAADGTGAALPGGYVRLQVVFKQDSWAEIHDAKGARLMSELGAAGTRRKLQGLAPIHLLFGNPDGVALALDGHPVTLAARSDNGLPLRFSLDGGGRVIEVRAAPAAAAALTTTP